MNASFPEAIVIQGPYRSMEKGSEQRVGRNGGHSASKKKEITFKKNPKRANMEHCSKGKTENGKE